jgi:hypothetical protein
MRPHQHALDQVVPKAAPWHLVRNVGTDVLVAHVLQLGAILWLGAPGCIPDLGLEKACCRVRSGGCCWRRLMTDLCRCAFGFGFGFGFGFVLDACTGSSDWWRTSGGRRHSSLRMSRSCTPFGVLLAKSASASTRATYSLAAS